MSEGDLMAQAERDAIEPQERQETIAWLVENHRGEVYEALYLRAVASDSTIHTDIIEAWKANHLKQVGWLSDTGRVGVLKVYDEDEPIYRVLDHRAAMSTSGEAPNDGR